MSKGSIQRLEYESRVLRGNRLGDPTQREVWVWLPPDYGASDLRYPVLYLLSGFTGRGRMSLNESPWSQSIDQRMEHLLEIGEAEPAILVLPDCFTRFGGSQYVNSSAIGRYEDYLVDEIVPFIDTTFRTLGDGHRGVLGKSSGGFAALRLAMQRPGVFAGVASHAGDVAFELCYQPDFPKLARMLASHGGVDAFLADFDATRKKTSPQIIAISVLAMAAAYSPNPAAPDGFDLPFDLHDLALREEVWNRWLAFDPLRMVDRPECAAALDQLDVLFLDAGNRDEYNLDFGARRFVKTLEAKQIRHRYEEFDDGHFSTSYRYDRSLPLLSRTLT